MAVSYTHLAAPDVNCDGRVNILDVQAVARRFATQPGNPLYDPQFDLDADDRIGILDMMVVAGRWQPNGGGHP